MKYIWRRDFVNKKKAIPEIYSKMAFVKILYLLFRIR